MTDQELVSEELLDYLLEMLNIGAGNAATALNQLLRCEVNVHIPAVGFHATFAEAFAALGDPAFPVVSSRMQMVGNVTGHLFFIVPDDQKMKLTELADRTLQQPGCAKQPGGAEPEPERVLTTLGEIGNILAGVSLTSIHDFCHLNIYHSVPVVAVDTLQAILGESLAEWRREGSTLILVKIEFIIGASQLKAFLLLVPFGGFLPALVESMKQMGRTYGGN